MTREAHPHAEAPARLAFFFSGFDPKGAGYYHRLYREGAAVRSGFGDVSIEVSGRHRRDAMASSCDIVWTAAGAHGTAVPTTRTRLHYMRWDDIVRRHWHRTPMQLLRDYANVYGIGLTHGDFGRIWRKSRAAWGMAIFPLVLALLVLVPGFVVGTWLLHGVLGLGVAGSVGLAGVVTVAAWRALVRVVDCEWLLRLYAFTQAQAAGRLPALEQRMDDMAAWLVQQVRARMREPAAGSLREVLVVGYSTGSTVASAVLARALPALEEVLREAGDTAPALSMLTLGHCVPVASDWAAAGGVRAELARLGDCDALTWHDWSSPADWAAFWRTPPWPEGSRLRGLQRSPRFHAQVDAAAYARLKRDRRLMHLQYLRPPGRPVDASGYDWFRFTAGPDILGATACAPSTSG